MQKTSRRSFLKGSLLALFTSSLFAKEFLEKTQKENLDLSAHKSTLVCDKSCFDKSLKADKTLIIDNDIAPIYKDLKEAFKEGVVIAKLQSEASAFVLSQMARDFNAHLAYEKRLESTNFSQIKHLTFTPKGVKL